VTAPPSSPLSVEAIGRVVATERRPNTPHEFHFWTALDAIVGVGTIVRVVGQLPIAGQIPVIYGVVVEGVAYTDVQSPLHDVLGADGDPAADARAPSTRTEIRLFTAHVLRQVPDEPLQPVPMGAVFLADARDVAIALRMDGYVDGERSTAIPVGLYAAGGTRAPVALDADFLVGPEAAHLSISGVSGLATKTSAVEWLLASLFAHFPAHRGSLAAVCFNVKGPDLCFLDQPAPLDDADRVLYEALDVPARPFERVRYFAPYVAGGVTLDTLRSHEALQHNVAPLTWGLSEVLQFADVLLTRDDVDAKADALIDFIRERVLHRDFEDGLLAQPHRVESFADLDAWFRDVLRAMEGRNQESWRTHHIATIRKVRNRLTNIATRCAGLITEDGATSDLPFGAFEDRTVYVVDVAGAEDDAQDLVFARIVSKLREHLERRDLGVQHVVVFVDELNKYAPADGPDTYVRKMLLDIAERGRYLGLVLFGAQQFRSQVHRRIVGNAGTTLYGRMDGDELATPGYATLGPAVRARLATLEKGQLMVRHPHYAQPVFVRFPRPAVLSGRAGVEQFPPVTPPTLDVAIARQLHALDPAVTAGWVQRVLGWDGTSAALYEEPAIVRALRATVRARPDDVRGTFERELRRGARAPVRDVAVAVRPAPLARAPRGDPYGD
jgi:hypothetical protein